MTYLLALDQGTSSSRSIVFDEGGHIVALAQQELPQIYPKPGWVEHNPEDIWKSVLNTLRKAVEQSHISVKDIVSIGITNQRETVVVWDKKTGASIYNAIVWQCRRTQDFCEKLKKLESNIIFTLRIAHPNFDSTNFF